MSLSLSLFGLERTGTTVTQWLLQRNFRARVNDGSKAWKHGPVAKEKMRHPEAPIVLCVRHPMDYLQSRHAMARAAGDTDKDLQEWCRYGSREQPWALRMWNYAYGYWRRRTALPSRADIGPEVFTLRLERLLADPLERLRTLGRILGLGTLEEVELPESYTGPRCGAPDGGFEEVRRRVLEEQRWRQRYDDDLLRHCWRRCDLELAAEYGYEPREGLL